MTTLKSGDIGIDVLQLQLRLGVRPTFYFDDRTTKAVMAFQKAHKLKPDGEVGPLTRKALDLQPTDKSIAVNPLKPWLPIAQSQIGVKENMGWWLWSDNRQIVEYHQSTKWPATSAETAWCSSFVNWVLKKSGRKGTNSAAAKSWLEWTGGDTVTTPERGDIVIIKNKLTQGHHVGFYISSPAGRIRILGGNQGKPGEVNEQNFLLKDYEILGYRRPKAANVAIYLKIGAIEGNVTAKGYEGWIQVATLHFGAERNVSMQTGNLSNRESGKPALSRIAITKIADKSVAALFQASLKGAAGQEATLAFVRTGKTMQEFMTYKLKDCILANYAIAMQADEAPVEGIMLSYSGIEISYKDHDASNKAGSPQRVAYDVKAAKVA